MEPEFNTDCHNEDQLMLALMDDDHVQVQIKNTNMIMLALMSNSLHNRSPNQNIPRNTRPFTGFQMIHDILNGHPKRCYDEFRMNSTNFRILCLKIMEKGIVKTNEVTIEEQVGMFLQTLGQACNMRKIGEDFQRSLETVHRTFDDVLRSVLAMHPNYIRLPHGNEPPHHSLNQTTGFYHFKGALGAIDGTHIPAIVRRHKQDRYRNRKGFVSQNVLAACNFDMKFVFLSVGWEGSAADMKVLNSALEDGGFTVPRTRYYLGDSGYANTVRFVCPFRGSWYHLGTFRRAPRCGYRTSKDLFNHRHCQLRNIIERAFGVLKKRFKVLVTMAPYKFRKQCLIVMACCIMHNFIKAQNDAHDIYLNMSDSSSSSEDDEPVAYEDLIEDETQGGEVLRASIQTTLWRQYRNLYQNRYRQ